VSSAGRLVAVRATAVSIDEVLAAVAHPSCGGITVFVGVVRDESEGRRVSRLEYSAYDAMAVAEMGRIADEIEREIPGARLAAVHRVGDLAVGDVAIACAAAAPHRAEAFRAARALIDRIKERVPVWKREHDETGATWVGWVDARCVGHDDHEHHDHEHHDHEHGR
jgi:molybdopterin synthase catalytic subunit